MPLPIRSIPVPPFATGPVFRSAVHDRHVRFWVGNLETGEPGVEERVVVLATGLSWT